MKNRLPLWVCTLTMLGVLVVCTPLVAGSSTGALAIALSVVPNCRVTAQDLPFGSYDPLVRHAQTSLDAASSLELVCTKNTPLTVVLGNGENGLSAEGARRMAGGNQLLSYQLFRDPGRKEVWGDGGAGVQVPGSGGRQAPNVLTIYGRIPSGQEVLAGHYADTVVAALEF